MSDVEPFDLLRRLELRPTEYATGTAFG